MYIKYSKIVLIMMSILSILVIYKYYKNNKKKINKQINLISNNLKKFIENKHNLIFIGIVITFLLTRLYMLSSIPFGVHIDEASVGYNAYSIAKYGVDRYLNPYPIYFLNFGNGQSAMYTYFAALLIKIFGYNLFILRIPSVVFGFITLTFGYLLGKELINKKFGLLVAFLITICPYFILASRFALDCNLMLGMFSASSYSLLKAIKEEKNSKYIISGLLFGLTLYSYALSYIILPVCLLLVLLYLLYTKKINIKQIICFVIPLVLLAIPLILSVLVQIKVLPEIITPYFSILKMGNDRVSEVSLSLSVVINNIKNVFQLLQNDPAYYNAEPKFGTLYLFSIPLVILGLLIISKKALIEVKKKKFNQYMYIYLLFIGTFIPMLFVINGYLYINHLNSIYIILVIFLALGIKKICEYIKDYWFIIISIYLSAFLYFSYFYFNGYSNYALASFDNGYTLAIKDAYNHSKKIYITNNMEQAGNLWAANELKISPYEYKENDNFSTIKFNIPKNIDNNYSYVIGLDEYSEVKFKGFQCKLFKNYYSCYKK